MKALILFLTLFGINVCGSAQIRSELQSEIDHLFSEWNNDDSPGAALGIIQNGELIYSKGYGMSDLENKVKISPDSKFYLPSTTKQFTAACIALLAIEGKLDLDDDVRKYIPEIPVYESTITIKHLIHHLSGLRDYLLIMELEGKSFEEHFTNQDGIEIISRQKSLNFPAGSRYMYSNSGYILLAEIVTRVSGVSMREFAHKRIFEPLGMESTFYNDDQKEKIKDKVISYKKVRKGIYESFDQNFEAHGDGNLITTINDLYQWDKNFEERKVGGNRLINLLLTNGLQNNGDTVQYAFGLNQGLYEGEKVIWHPGGMLGFGSQYIRFPNQNLSIIILTNAQEFDPTTKSLQVADILLKSRRVKNEEQPLILEKDIQNKVELSISDLEKFTSLYWNHKDDYSRRIYLKKDNLYYSRTNGSESRLIPISQSTFQMVGISTNVTVKFNMKGQEPYKMFVTVNDRAPSELFAYESKKYNKKELEEFVGLYDSEEIDCLYEIQNENRRLILYRNGENLGKLESIMPNIFHFKKYMKLKFDSLNSAQFSINVDGVKGIQFKKK